MGQSDGWALLPVLLCRLIPPPPSRFHIPVPQTKAELSISFVLCVATLTMMQTQACTQCTDPGADIVQLRFFLDSWPIRCSRASNLCDGMDQWELCFFYQTCVGGIPTKISFPHGDCDDFQTLMLNGDGVLWTYELMYPMNFCITWTSVSHELLYPMNFCPPMKFCISCTFVSLNLAVTHELLYTMNLYHMNFCTKWTSVSHELLFPMNFCITWTSVSDELLYPMSFCIRWTSVIP